MGRRNGCVIGALVLLLAACSGGGDAGDETSAVTTDTASDTTETRRTTTSVTSTIATTSTTSTTSTTVAVTFARPPEDAQLASSILAVDGYELGDPGPHDVPWPQFELPDDVTAHVVLVSTEGRTLGSLVAVGGLDALAHIDAMFSDGVQVIAGQTDVAGGRMFVSNGARPGWRDHGVPVVEATVPDDHVGQWLWSNGDTTWIAAGSEDMSAYVDALIALQQRQGRASPFDHELIAGPLLDRRVDVPGYTLDEFPTADVMRELGSMGDRDCFAHVYMAGVVPDDDADPATLATEHDVFLIAATIAPTCIDAGYVESVTDSLTASGLVSGDIEGVVAYQSPGEVVVLQDGVLIDLLGADEVNFAATRPFIERFVANRAPEELVDRSTAPVPTCIYRRADHVQARLIEFATDCGTPHQAELYFRGDLAGRPGSAYPGNDAVDGAASKLCLDAFGPFVGVAFDSSRLGYLYYFPDEADWAGGDRTVNCVLFDGDVDRLVRGSFAGAKV